MMHEGIDGQPVMSPGAKWQLALIMHLSHGGGSLRELYVLKCRNEGLSTYWPCKPGMPLGKICSGMPMTYDEVWLTSEFTDMPATCMSCHGLLHDCCMKHSTRLMVAALHEDVSKSIQEENNTFHDPSERLLRRADYPRILRSCPAPTHYSYDEVHAFWMINGSGCGLFTHPGAYHGCGLHYCFRCCDMLVRDDTLLLHEFFDSDSEESEMSVDEFEVEDILDKWGGGYDVDRPLHYLVKWVGYPDPTWELAEDLHGCQQTIDEYEEELDSWHATDTEDDESACELDLNASD